MNNQNSGSYNPDFLLEQKVKIFGTFTVWLKIDFSVFFRRSVYWVDYVPPRAGPNGHTEISKSNSRRFLINNKFSVS